MSWTKTRVASASGAFAVAAAVTATSVAWADDSDTTEGSSIATPESCVQLLPEGVKPPQIIFGEQAADDAVHCVVAPGTEPGGMPTHIPDDCEVIRTDDAMSEGIRGEDGPKRVLHRADHRVSGGEPTCVITIIERDGGEG
ncbi:hypothetical protein [Hoyosella altamirensis]|uniref:Secreted protein n=1 Tax=Hoyosella altamirensis TaxID=616997 RepID=A0A839RW17_9ACTN|nr:hypothetical protein [Hoyosella altamirensis]MBB3040033.1 hypothetical protein [Hoyosella altamirensis]